MILIIDRLVQKRYQRNGKDIIRSVSEKEGRCLKRNKK